MTQNLGPTAEKPRIRPAPLKALAGNASGVAAVEFSLILPLTLMLLGLCFIGAEALAIGQKVSSTARTIVDIVSQNKQLSTTQMTAILDAAAYTMAPYSSADLSMVVAEVQTNSKGVATVTWSAAAYNGKALANGSSFTLPAAMSVANATYIYGQVSYAYTPLSIGFTISSPIALTDVSYFVPRTVTAIQYPYPN